MPQRRMTRAFEACSAVGGEAQAFGTLVEPTLGGQLIDQSTQALGTPAEASADGIERRGVVVVGIVAGQVEKQQVLGHAGAEASLTQHLGEQTMARREDEDDGEEQASD